MPDPGWGEDTPADEAVIAANIANLLAELGERRCAPRPG